MWLQGAPLEDIGQLWGLLILSGNGDSRRRRWEVQQRFLILVSSGIAILVQNRAAIAKLLNSLDRSNTSYMPKAITLKGSAKSGGSVKAGPPRGPRSDPSCWGKHFHDSQGFPAQRHETPLASRKVTCMSSTPRMS